MTQEELEALARAKSSLMDGELSKIARSLEDIINKYRDRS